MASGYANIILGTPDLAAYWRLGESSGTSAADASGNGRTGTYTNGFTLGAPGGVTGDGNTGVTLDGVDGHVVVANHASLHPASQITVEALISRAVTGVTHVVAAAGASTGNDWWLDITANAIRFGVKVGGSIYFPSGGTLAALTKYHVAGVYDGETVRVYLNGTQVASDATPSGNMNTTTQAVTLGTYSDATVGFFNGVLDEVAIYGRALTAQEIATRYRASIDAFLPQTRRRLAGI
jgi:hypothetical protein